MLHGTLGQRIPLYEGSTRIIYNGLNEDTLILHFKKRDDFDLWRNKIAESIWLYLKNVGIENHFIKTLNVREQLISSVNVFPIFLRLHSITQDDLHKRLGIEEGTVFTTPLIEWHLKSKFLKDPMVSRDHIEYFGWVKPEDIKKIHKLAIRTNDVLRALMCCLNLRPSVIELHFGIKDGEILLIGELSPETILFWDEQNLTTLPLEATYLRMQSFPQFLK
jgi:phosphoribosylaminoimidazole-succinocarboxamide synthase